MNPAARSSAKYAVEAGLITPHADSSVAAQVEAAALMADRRQRDTASSNGVPDELILVAIDRARTFRGLEHHAEGPIHGL